MSRKLASLVILLVTALGYGQTQRVLSAADEQTKKRIISLENKGWELFQRKDITASAALLADEYQDVGEFGVWDKKKSLQGIPDTGYKLSSFSLHNFRFIRLAPTVVLLTYEATQTGSSDGKPLPSPLFISSVWVNRQGKWLNILFQDTPAATTTPSNSKTSASAIGRKSGPRVTLKYRALAVKFPDEYLWFWMGEHNVYDALTK